jgi:hypothetical protein
VSGELRSERKGELGGDAILTDDELDALAAKTAQPDPIKWAARMTAFADELIDPMICREPAYGVPGRAHCAACCYGTGLVITCEAEQAIADAAEALRNAARFLAAMS